MRQRLVHVDPLCAARLGAALALTFGLLALPFLYYAFVVAPVGIGFSPLVVLLSPVLLAGLGLTAAALACGLFNWLAARFGGLEVDFRDVGAD